MITSYSYIVLYANDLCMHGNPHYIALAIAYNYIS